MTRRLISQNKNYINNSGKFDNMPCLRYIIHTMPLERLKIPDIKTTLESKLNRILNALDNRKRQQKDFLKIPHFFSTFLSLEKRSALMDNVRIHVATSMEEFDVDRLNLKAIELSNFLQSQGISDMQITPARKVDEEGGMTFGWIETNEIIGVNKITREVFVIDSMYRPGLQTEIPIERKIRVILHPSEKVAKAAVATELGKGASGLRLETFNWIKRERN